MALHGMARKKLQRRGEAEKSDSQLTDYPPERVNLIPIKERLGSKRF